MDKFDSNNNTNRLELLLNDENNDFVNLRIGDKAPEFDANTTFGKIKLSDYKDKWLILFSHPGDFTPVCTTEFLSFSKMYPEFQKRNCELLGLSIDSTPSHLAWVNNILKTTGIQVPFPIIEDRDMKIAKMYVMIAPNEKKKKTIRSVFFINPEQKISAILEYPMENGRNITEILRLLDAMQISAKDKVMTPANWLPGQPTILPPPSTYPELIDNKNNINGFNCIDWYLCFNLSNNPSNPNITSNQNTEQFIANTSQNNNQSTYMENLNEC